MLFQKSILLAVAFLISNALIAATITWTGNGPNNFYSNSGNWDTGNVPNTFDDVIIPAGSGTVRFNFSNRRARTVTVETGSTLQIIGGAKLRILSPIIQPMINRGILLVQGTLVINNSTNIGLLNYGTLDNRGLIRMNNQGGNGLFNEGEVFNRSGGELRFLNIVSAGIRTFGGAFLNEGVVRFLAGGTGTGISVGDNFENALTGSIIFENGHTGTFTVYGSSALNNGSISFTNSAPINFYSVYISTGDLLTNGPTGLISVNGFSGSAGITLSSSSKFKNKGFVFLTNGSNPNAIGITTTFAGGITNEAGASIETSFISTGIRLIGSFDNFGRFDCSDTSTGIVNFGDLSNYDDGLLDFDNVGTGINNDPTGNVVNKHGTLLFNNISNFDILNSGKFYNYGCGFIEGDNEIFNNNGIFENDAWLSYPSSGNNHSYSGDPILNTGIVNDPFDRFATALDNQEARIIALVSPQANERYSDAFDIANITTTDFSDFYLDPNLNILAGVYDYPSNTFVANNAAVGATVLYVKGSQDCSHYIELRIDGMIVPIVNNQKKDLMLPKTKSSDQVNAEQLKIYPNPTTGYFQAQLPKLSEGTYELQILNAQGQLMITQKGDARLESNTAIDLNDHPAGMYWARLSNNGQLVAQEKIILIR